MVSRGMHLSETVSRRGSLSEARKAARSRCRALSSLRACAHGRMHEERNQSNVESVDTGNNAYPSNTSTPSLVLKLTTRESQGTVGPVPQMRRSRRCIAALMHTQEKLQIWKSSN